VESNRNLAHAPEPEARGPLQNLCELRRKRAAGGLLAISASTFPALRTLLLGLLLRTDRWRSCRWLWRLWPTRGILAFRWLRRVGPQQAVFERRPIETADDGGHLIGGRRFDKCEALRFLRFVITDYFDAVGHQIFGGQPLLDVISGDPRGQIAQKNGKAHSVII